MSSVSQVLSPQIFTPPSPNKVIDDDPDFVRTKILLEGIWDIREDQQVFAFALDKSIRDLTRKVDALSLVNPQEKAKAETVFEKNKEKLSQDKKPEPPNSQRSEQNTDLKKSVSEQDTSVSNIASLIRPLITEKKFKEAVSILSDALQKDSENLDALKFRGKLYHLLKQPDQALADLTKCVQLKPDDNSALVWRAEIYFEQKEYKKAARDLSEALKTEKTSKAYEKLGDTYRLYGEYEKALVCFDQAVKYDPKNSSALESRGAVFLRLERYKEALRDLSAAISMGSQSHYALVKRADVYFELQEYKKAAEDLLEALKIKKKAETYLKLGQACALQEKLEKRYEIAITCFTNSIELNKNVAYTWECRGVVYLEQKKYKEALQDLNTAIELDPESWYAFVKRAEVYLKIKDYDRAATDLVKSFRIKKTALALQKLGKAYRLLGNYKETITVLNGRLKIEPDNASTLKNRGYAFFELEQYDEALKDLNKALDLKPKSHFALFTRGRLYARLEKYEKALKDFKAALDIHYNADGLARCGHAVYLLDRHDEAYDYFTRAVKLEPKNDYPLKLMKSLGIKFK